MDQTIDTGYFTSKTYLAEKSATDRKNRRTSRSLPLEFLYVNVNDDYFIENEAVPYFPAPFLTFIEYLACFFK